MTKEETKARISTIYSAADVLDIVSAIEKNGYAELANELARAVIAKVAAEHPQSFNMAKLALRVLNNPND